MKQAIAGVSPSGVAETEVMTVWPSVCATGPGRMLGSAYAIKFPDVYIFRLGNLLALLSIPLVLPLYFWKVLPFVGTCYTLTNRRVVVKRGGGKGVEQQSVALDKFDDIKIDVREGQAWFKAGDLIFLSGDREVFRLAGVSRPEAFRAACLKGHMAYVGIQAALARA